MVTVSVAIEARTINEINLSVTGFYFELT